jgi:hypothetical protein
MSGCSSSSFRSVSVACIAALWLCACDDAPTDSTSQPGTSQKSGKTSEIALPPEFVSAVSAGGNSSVISVHFALRNVPTASEALPVDIAIVPHQMFTAVRAHFDSRDGLAVATGTELATKSDPKPEKPIEHKLVLMPGRDGVFMVSAIVETEGADGTISRVFSIPVIVAPQAAPAPAPGTGSQPAAGSQPASGEQPAGAPASP